jgi:GT2 family glycosyltransferase
VIVVDDGSADDTRERLAERLADQGAGAWLSVLAQGHGGPAHARNRGARQARGELLVFIGDDTVPEPGFLAAHVEAHAALPAEPPPRARAVLGYTGWDRERMRVTPLLVHLNEQGPQFGYALIQDPEDVPFAFFYTSNISLPTAVFLEAGGFDESFPAAAWEDVEFAYRAARSGRLRIVYRPKARIRHDHPTTLKDSMDRQHRVGRAGALLLERHPELGEWLGVDRAMKTPVARTRWLDSLERTIRMADPLGIRLPGRAYRELLDWHYLTGLRIGIEERAGTPPRQPDCITP